MSDHLEMDPSRRSFLKLSLAGSAVALAASALPLAADDAPRSEIWVIHGSDNAALMNKAIALISAHGGFAKTPLKTLALKVNAAWDRTPEQGANTDPVLVREFLRHMKASGVSVVIPEHACDNARQSFVKSGIYAVAEQFSFVMKDLQQARKGFVKTSLPLAKSMKSALVWPDFLQADAVVNMPVAKHHGGASMTCAMKNWMGAVRDRGFFHRHDLHQCIADISSLIRPAWTIADCTRVMLTNGPKGPGKLNPARLLVLSRDQVAVDAWVASQFFPAVRKELRYLDLAQSMGIGVCDLNRITVNRLEV